MLASIFFLAIVILYLGYRYYGTFLEKTFKINPKTRTPAHTLKDGVDFVPASRAILFGHHFSSIAGAGPVLGPIIAAIAFGWLPALVWLIIGTIFIGGVHDFSALVSSVRHQGKSIAEIAHEHLTPRIFKIFLIFIWLSLVYVLMVFIDLTATTLTSDGSVATAASLFILLALFLGIALYRFKVSLIKASLIFVPLAFVAVYIGHIFPTTINGNFFGSIKQSWSIILICYAFLASVSPVWLLLQPRDFLSSFLLFASIIIGFIGIFLGKFSICYPPFVTFVDKTQGPMFPFLFVIIACGAVSGFHSIVSSGTTAKQLNNETDAKPVAYGGMIVETVVALIALATVMIVSHNGAMVAKTPLAIYGAGMAKFAAIIGIPEKFGFSFGLLALSTFLLTTLDTATRLARYIFQEFFNLKETKHRFIATAMTLLLPLITCFMTITNASGKNVPVWKAIWPVFGTTNQLLAAMTLLVVSVWLSKKKIKNNFIKIPMVAMYLISMWALFLLTLKYKLTLIGIISILLFILAVVLAVESFQVVKRKR
ncbi:carbon starvation protein A [bacterium]|nr:carbon starvation protein A [bacterium]